MPGRKKRTSCAHCRIRKRRHPSVYCSKHTYMTIDKKGESGSEDRSMQQSKETEVVVETTELPLVASIIGCPLLSNKLSITILIHLSVQVFDWRKEMLIWQSEVTASFKQYLQGWSKN